MTVEELRAQLLALTKVVDTLVDLHEQPKTYQIPMSRVRFLQDALRTIKQKLIAGEQP